MNMWLKKLLIPAAFLSFSVPLEATPDEDLKTFIAWAKTSDTHKIVGRLIEKTREMLEPDVILSQEQIEAIDTALSMARGQSLRIHGSEEMAFLQNAIQQRLREKGFDIAGKTYKGQSINVLGAGFRELPDSFATNGITRIIPAIPPAQVTASKAALLSKIPEPRRGTTPEAIIIDAYNEAMDPTTTEDTRNKLLKRLQDNAMSPADTAMAPHIQVLLADALSYQATKRDPIMLTSNTITRVLPPPPDPAVEEAKRARRAAEAALKQAKEAEERAKNQAEQNRLRELQPRLKAHEMSAYFRSDEYQPSPEVRISLAEVRSIKEEDLWLRQILSSTTHQNETDGDIFLAVQTAADQYNAILKNKNLLSNTSLSAEEYTKLTGKIQTSIEKIHLLIDSFKTDEIHDPSGAKTKTRAILTALLHEADAVRPEYVSSAYKLPIFVTSGGAGAGSPTAAAAAAGAGSVASAGAGAPARTRRSSTRLDDARVIEAASASQAEALKQQRIAAVNLVAQNSLNNIEDVAVADLYDTTVAEKVLRAYHSDAADKVDQLVILRETQGVSPELKRQIKTLIAKVQQDLSLNPRQAAAFHSGAGAGAGSATAAAGGSGAGESASTFAARVPRVSIARTAVAAAPKTQEQFDLEQMNQALRETEAFDAARRAQRRQVEVVATEPAPSSSGPNPYAARAIADPEEDEMARALAASVASHTEGEAKRSIEALRATRGPVRAVHHGPAGGSPLAAGHPTTAWMNPTEAPNPDAALRPRRTSRTGSPRPGARTAH